MSNSLRTMTFSVTVADVEDWTEEQRDRADRCTECVSYDDHAVHLVENFMRKAGNAVLRNKERRQMYLSDEVS